MDSKVNLFLMPGHSGLKGRRSIRHGTTWLWWLGRLSPDAQAAWEDIEPRSITGDPKHLADQLTKTGSSSATERRVFKSLLGVASKKRTNLEAARLIKRVRVRHFDNTVDAVAGRDCTLLLRLEAPSVGNDLWIELQTIASRYRISGGTLDLPELLSELRNKYKLKDHPNFRAAWQSVNQRSLSNCNAVHSVAGQDTLVVFADSDMDGVKNAKPRHVTAVVGDSGTGKSSLVKSDTRTMPAQTGPAKSAPDFGPNVTIFDPSTSDSVIQAKLDSISTEGEFSENRHAVFFKPGTYAVNYQVGYYASIPGLGLSPDSVVINGGLRAEGRIKPGKQTDSALVNFWRSVENLSITPDGGSTRWAVSQAS